MTMDHMNKMRKKCFRSYLLKEYLRIFIKWNQFIIIDSSGSIYNYSTAIDEISLAMR